MKIFSRARPQIKKRKSHFARHRGEEGSFLIEVLVAGSILLLLAATAVTHLSSLTNIKVQTETRDRAFVLINSLHENMQAAGCGFDISPVKQVAGTNISPWARVGSCAFKAIEANRTSGVLGTQLDEDGNLLFSTLTLAEVYAFCDAKGEGTPKRCELGDQDFSRKLTLNDSNITVTYNVDVHYWFEKTGITNSANACTKLNASGTLDPGMPDVIVRKIDVSWPNPNKDTGTEKISIIKRQNIPSDTLEFSSSSRVGVYKSGATSSLTLYTKITDVSGAVVDKFQVTRNSGGMSCIWFPYINKDAGTVTFSTASPNLSAFPALENVELP